MISGSIKEASCIYFDALLFADPLRVQIGSLKKIVLGQKCKVPSLIMSHIHYSTSKELRKLFFWQK